MSKVTKNARWISSANVTNSFQSMQFPTYLFGGFLQFFQKVQEIQRLAIPHLKGLIVDIFNIEG